MSPGDRQAYQAKQQEEALTTEHGQLHPMMVCPHCQEKGHVRTQPVTRKKGVSGGKATAALLTGGVSLLATGLSRKEQSTEGPAAIAAPHGTFDNAACLEWLWLTRYSKDGKHAKARSAASAWSSQAIRAHTPISVAHAKVAHAHLSARPSVPSQ